MVSYIDAEIFTNLRNRLEITLPQGNPITDDNADEVRDIYRELLGSRVFREGHDKIIKSGILSPIMVYLRLERLSGRQGFPVDYIIKCYEWFGIDYSAVIATNCYKCREF